MGLFSFLKEKQPQYKFLVESAKGKVESSTEKSFQFNLPRDAEPHPKGIDFGRLHRVYKDDAFIHGAVTKFADFIVSPGFFVKSKDPRIEEISSQFMRAKQFASLLRQYVTEALITGNSYLLLGEEKKEITLKILNSEHMYVLRDDFGKVLGYVQMFRNAIGQQPTIFKESEIAHLKINVVGDCAYGVGKIHPAMYALKNKNELMSDMMLLMRRKANAPFHFKIGAVRDSAANDVVPSDADLSALGQSLQWLNNKHEWVTNAFVDIKAVDFGSVGDKFVAPLDQFNQELVFALQVPAVLMGVANVPEGLAAEQMKAFMFNVRALQEEIEKVLEEKLFSRLMQLHGLDMADVEFEWGSQTPEDKRDDLASLMQVLTTVKSFSQPVTMGFGDSAAVVPPSTDAFGDDFMQQVEARVRKLLEFDDKPADRDDDEEEPQPRAPPQKLKRDVPEEAFVHEDFSEDSLDLSVREFVGFSYQEYLKRINDFIDSERFEKREYKTFRYTNAERTEWKEEKASYDLREMLGDKKLGRLRSVLKNGFDEGASMRDIAKDIREVVRPGDLEFTDVNGVPRVLSEKARSINMARVEVIRASNQGALASFRTAEIDRVKWVAATGDRTCEYCDAQNGKIMSIDEADEAIPVHNLCRCSFAAVVTSD